MVYEEPILCQNSARKLLYMVQNDDFVLPSAQIDRSKEILSSIVHFKWKHCLDKFKCNTICALNYLDKIPGLHVLLYQL